MSIAKGTQVRQVVKAIEGVVSAKRFNDDEDKFEYCVDFDEADGHKGQRWFLEGQIESTEPPEEKPAEGVQA